MLAAGCSNAPPAPPAYPAPDAYTARLAYADALRASLRAPGNPDEAPPPGEESGFAAMARGGRIARAERVIENNAVIRKSIASLATAEVSGCAWTALDLEEATGGADVDASTYPSHAWRCSVRIVHDTERRGRVEATTQGWFYKLGDRFVYLGKAAHGFKRSADIAKGLA
jgi:hypothetical protein